MAYERRSTSSNPGKRVDYGLADQARAEKRKQQDAGIDTAATKWRYSPTPATARKTR
jgi:hypothetical protein